MKLPGPAVQLEDIHQGSVERLVCVRPGCLSTRLYKPVNSPKQDEEYDQLGIFLLYCMDCQTFQNHSGKSDQYRAWSEVRDKLVL